MEINKLQKQLRKYSSNKQAKALQRFFKTGPGEYGEGDIFIGLKVPQIRKAIKKYYKDITLKEVIQLLKSKLHEERLAALLILVKKFCEGSELDRVRIYKAYLGNTKYINNWDLVDLSAGYIVGQFLWRRDKAILYKLAKSQSLWERRIAIIATFYFIRENQFRDSTKIAQLLLCDTHDLIHKAVGWMLREIGKRDLSAEEAFLTKFYKKMPRTMLRYAIERFLESRRQMYLRGKI